MPNHTVICYKNIHTPESVWFSKFYLRMKMFLLPTIICFSLGLDCYSRFSRFLHSIVVVVFFLE